MAEQHDGQENQNNDRKTPTGEQLASILAANVADLRNELLATEAWDEALIAPFNTIMDEIREELSLFELDEEGDPDSGDLMSDEDFEKLLECIQVDGGMEEEQSELESLEWDNNTPLDDLIEIERRVINLIRTENRPYFNLLSKIGNRLNELAAQSDDTKGYDWFD
jgi:hypothetical protein